MRPGAIRTVNFSFEVGGHLRCTGIGFDRRLKWARGLPDRGNGWEISVGRVSTADPQRPHDNRRPRLPTAAAPLALWIAKCQQPLWSVI